MSYIIIIVVIVIHSDTTKINKKAEIKVKN